MNRKTRETLAAMTVYGAGLLAVALVMKGPGGRLVTQTVQPFLAATAEAVLGPPDGGVLQAFRDQKLIACPGISAFRRSDLRGNKAMENYVKKRIRAGLCWIAKP